MNFGRRRGREKEESWYFRLVRTSLNEGSLLETGTL